MRKSRITETKIFAILKEADAGVLVQDICRKYSRIHSLHFRQISNGYSEPFRPPIPTEAGHPFRGKAATDSDVKAATFRGLVGTGSRNASE